MSQFLNPRYEAMTPAQKVAWHKLKSRTVQDWKINGHTNAAYMTDRSWRESRLHEVCADRIASHYRLND